MVLGSMLLWFCAGRRVLLGEVAVKSGMTELEQALGARAECVGTSGFTTREDVLLATASPAALQTARQVKGA